MKLSLLLRDVNFTGSFQDCDVTDVTDNSNEVTAGSVFVCVKGAHSDGHDFAAGALAQGAAAVVVSRPLGLDREILVDNPREAYALLCKNLYGRACDELTLVGITGTNGKSTTSALLGELLTASGERVGAIGTLGNRVGDRVFPTALTTPGPHEMHRLFRMMVDEGIRICTVEATSQALDQCRLAGVRFKVAVFTNLTQDHLDYHGSIEAYRRCKKQLFYQCDIPLINRDDESAAFMLADLPVRAYTYGREGADFTAENVRVEPERVTYTLDGEAIAYAAPGDFSVYNSLAAVSCMKLLGYPLHETAQAVASAHTLKGRLEILKADAPFVIVIDYAHTPDGLEKALTAVRGFTPGRVFVVFGCGGDRDRTKRPKMGRLAADLSDVAVITTDNPRTEDPDGILKEILIGTVGSKAEVVTIRDRTDAIRYALTKAKAGDTVLLAGKGHETYQIIGTERVHYDEREVVRNILAEGKGN